MHVKGGPGTGGLRKNGKHRDYCGPGMRGSDDFEDQDDLRNTHKFKGPKKNFRRNKISNKKRTKKNEDEDEDEENPFDNSEDLNVLENSDDSEKLNISGNDSEELKDSDSDDYDDSEELNISGDDSEELKDSDSDDYDDSDDNDSEKLKDSDDDDDSIEKLKDSEDDDDGSEKLKDSEDDDDGSEKLKDSDNDDDVIEKLKDSEDDDDGSEKLKDSEDDDDDGSEKLKDSEDDDDDGSGKLKDSEDDDDDDGSEKLKDSEDDDDDDDDNSIKIPDNDKKYKIYNYNNNSQKNDIIENCKIDNIWEKDLDKFYNERNGSSFERSTCNGNKKALFVGIIYKGTENELNGPLNDVKNISKLVHEKFGFEDCLYLTEDQKDQTKKPTYNNIIKGMKWLVEGAKSGDSLFFHYSGHGGTVEDEDGDEIDGFDETIVPLDFEKKGHILDDLIYETMIEPLPKGCRLTAIFDCCHSGTIMDLPYTYQCDGTISVIENDMRKEIFKQAYDLITNDKSIKKEDIATALLSIFDGNMNELSNKTVNKRKHDADVIQFSGCKDNQVSYDISTKNKSHGAMTYAIVRILNKCSDLSYTELLTKIREIMLEKDYDQIPQLCTSHPMNMNEKFIM